MQPTLGAADSSRRGLWISTALALLAAVAIYGFVSRHLWRQEIWQSPGGERFLIFLAAAAIWFGGWILWRPPWLAPATLSLAVVYTAATVGALPVLAVVLFLFACYALGRLLLARLAGEASPLLALLTGLAAYLWIGGIAAHFAVNYPLVWLALLAAPVASNPRNTAACLRETLAAAGPVYLDSRLEYAALALAVVPLAAHWLVVLKPEVSTDALSMHLMVPAYMAGHHLWSFDFRWLVWSVMPMGAVWGYSIVYLLGGEFAARLLNLALLLALAWFVFSAARRWTGRPVAFLLTALFAATPVVQLVTGSVFVETFYAVLLAGALAALWRTRESGPAWLAVCAFLLGSSMAVKLLALPFVGAIGAVLAWEMVQAWRGGARRWVPVSAALFLAAAALPYAYAWTVTGNPIFPFANQVFRSPYYAPVMSPDTRFSEPLTWRAPFDATFETHRYWEGQDGSIGFHLLLLAPLVLLSVRRDWKFREWTLVAAAFGGAVLGLALRPNVRYLYPAFPLLTASLALVPGAAGRRHVRLFAAAAMICLAMNLWFLPSSSWHHKTFCLNPFERGAAEQYLATAAPVRLLIDRLNRTHPGDNALFLETGGIAELRGKAYTNGWHSYAFLQKVATLRTRDDALGLLRQLDVRHFLYPDPVGGIPVRQAVLKELIDGCSRNEAAIGGFRLAALAPCTAESPDPAAPANYDDLDARISYRGDWSHDTQFAQAASRSITYSDTPGAAFQFHFRGSAVTWVYTRALNRGIAEVFLDGQPQGEIDLYSAEIIWQARTNFHAAAGEHILEVRVTGRRNARSSGVFVDADQLIVE